ncbi:hypothetical protein I7I48_04245 [Histoplasma ohiense]|nr:hypothetical protein I7I48_04245 [Histoplasma ohiense (nom. inval.)]
MSRALKAFGEKVSNNSKQLAKLFSSKKRQPVVDFHHQGLARTMKSTSAVSTSGKRSRITQDTTTCIFR